jgi:hypothetical protein
MGYMKHPPPTVSDGDLEFVKGNTKDYHAYGAAQDQYDRVVIIEAFE